MGTLLTTNDGIEISVSSVPRTVIDGFLGEYPPPKPPTLSVMAWGDLEEQVPNPGDPDYQNEMFIWIDKTSELQIARFLELGAIELLNDSPKVRKSFEELCQLMGLEDTELNYLIYGVFRSHRNQLLALEEIYYLSTVTQRGIAEAIQRFGVKWAEKDILDWRLPTSFGVRAQMFEDYKASLYCNYNWTEFTALPGPEQSQCVAYYQASTRIEWLSQKVKTNNRK